jgi:hypothetical protein
LLCIAVDSVDSDFLYGHLAPTDSLRTTSIRNAVDFGASPTNVILIVNSRFWLHGEAEAGGDSAAECRLRDKEIVLTPSSVGGVSPHFLHWSEVPELGFRLSCDRADLRPVERVRVGPAFSQIAQLWSCRVW